MKKYKIASIVCIGLALILEILPFGIIMKWDSFYQTATYHSYFDLTVFGYGDIAPFICAVVTVILLCMVLSSFFFKGHKIYLLSVCALTLCAVVLSLIPTFFGEYSIFGLAITVLLSVATELNILVYLNRSK